MSKKSDKRQIIVVFVTLLITIIFGGCKKSQGDCNVVTNSVDNSLGHNIYTCREYSVYTKKKRQRRLSINSLSIIYSYMDYKRLGRNSHFEREEMQGYSDAFIDLDKVPIVINGKKL